MPDNDLTDFAIRLHPPDRNPDEASIIRLLRIFRSPAHVGLRGVKTPNALVGGVIGIRNITRMLHTRYRL